MAKRKTSATRTVKRGSIASDPVVLRARFFRAAARKSLKQLEEISTSLPGSPQVSAKSLSDVVGAFVKAFRLYGWCRSVEQQLDHGTDFLRENWNNLSKADRESLENDLADLLNSYAESC